MADDYKIVNTTKLDAGMTATADKIRSKTHKTDKISWNENTGFSSEIETQNKSVTPTAAGQTVKSDAGYVGLSEVTIDGDDDLKAGNIANGVSIFGVLGTFEGITKIAEGNFQTTIGAIKDMPKYITGLGFKPKKVIIFKDFYSNGPSEQWIQTKGILYADSSGAYIAPFYYEAYNEETDETYQNWYIGCPAGIGSLVIDLNADGFTVRATVYGAEAGEPTNDLAWAQGVYRYIAIG